MTAAAHLQLKDWLPAALFRQDGRFWVDWVYQGRDRLLEPFFDGDLNLRMHLPFNQLFRQRTGIDSLGEWHELQPGLQPSGFIFHMSRCGSTLLSQMLAALPQNVVISEAGPIDAVLRAGEVDPELSEQQQMLWLRWMISALGQPRQGGERHLFVKFASWHTLLLERIRRAFPAVPWIFLYRDPVEVLVSQLQQRGPQLVPSILGPERFGIDFASAVAMRPEEYCARVLSAICRAALQQCSAGDAKLINYTQLPQAAGGLASTHFGLDCSREDHARMNRRAALDAKTPELPFAADSAAKQERAQQSIRAQAEAWLGPIYRELEQRRTQPNTAW